MKIDDILHKISNASRSELNATIDEITDFFEAGAISNDNAVKVVSTLESLVAQNSPSSDQESFFNLLSSMYLSGTCREQIEKIALDRMPTLNANSIEHCIVIISESNLLDRERILRSLENHESPHIRKVVSEELNKPLKPRQTRI